MNLLPPVHNLFRGVRGKKVYVYLSKESLRPFSPSPLDLYLTDCKTICYVSVKQTRGLSWLPVSIQN